MASSQFPILRTPEQPQQSRVQDGIASVFNPVAKALQNTPIMGAPAPAWIQPDLLNGWANIGAQFATAAFHRDALGYVHCKGVLSNAAGAAAGSTIFALPMGYRPAQQYRFAVEGTSATAQFINVTPVGLVSPDVVVAAGGTCDVVFTFLAEQ